MTSQTFIITNEHEKKRLDMFLLSQFPMQTRSAIKNQIEQGSVLVNGSVVKSGTSLKVGDKVLFTQTPPKQIDLTPENIPLQIVHEDNDLIVINKQAGLVVHPGGGSYSGTLVNALLFHAANLSQINGQVRPGIVHRLDKETSGLMMVAKNNAAHLSLSKQIANKTCIRNYIAICDGVIAADNKIITTFIGRHPKNRKMMAVLPQGRNAVTHLTVLQRFKQYTLCEFRLQTGRTHQIRVHAKHIGHPVTNDTMYGTPNKHVGTAGQLLHSCYLSFVHPTSGKTMEFSAQPPPAFANFLLKAQKE